MTISIKTPASVGASYRPNGKGDGRTALPLSRKSFQRSLPLRLASVEDAVDTHDGCINALAARVEALEARANDTADTASVEIAQCVNDTFRLALGKRHSRRRPAASRK